MPLYQLILLVVLCIALLSYLIFCNYTVESINKYHNLSAEEIMLRQELIRKYSLLKSLEFYHQRELELQRLESQIATHFPNSDQLPDVLITVNQLASDSRVAVVSFTPGINNQTTAQENGGKIVAQTFRLNLTASYLDFVSFVYKLAQLPRVIELLNLHLTRLDQNNLNIVCDLTIFYRSY